MTGDPALVVLSRRIRDRVVRAQNPGLGWGYGSRSGINDSSITCWMLQALLADPAEKKRVETSVVSGWSWLRRASDRGGNIGYDLPGAGSSFLQRNLVRTNQARNPVRGRFRLPTLAAHALLVADLHPTAKAKRRTRTWLKSLRRFVPRLLARNLPQVGVDTGSYYYWFVGSHALVRYPREWARWSSRLVHALATQRSGSCAQGSWEPSGEWCQVGGRVYATAINALTLQAPYRLKPE